MFALTNKVAIVTGGGRGIGKAIAIGFAHAGAHVVIAEIEATTAAQTAAEIRGLGKKALGLPTDVCDALQVANMVRQTVDEFGTIDILVNNAGGVAGLKAPIFEMSEATWDDVIRLNLKSVFLCSKAVGKVMLDKKKGNIINISSIAGVAPRPGMAHFGAAKAGVIHLTQTLGVELAQYNIRVNTIAPGSFTTPLHIRALEDPEQRQRRMEAIPLRRFGEPEDIVGAAIYLASDASSYVTGEVLSVGGGLQT